jgi:hypothetical protein
MSNAQLLLPTASDAVRRQLRQLGNHGSIDRREFILLRRSGRPA